MKFRKPGIVLDIGLFIFLVSCNLSTTSNNIPSTEAIQVHTQMPLEATEVLIPTEIVFTPTMEPTARPIYLMNQPLAVVSVMADDFLKVYSSPGIEQSIFTQLAPNTLHIESTGDAEWVDGQYWVKIKLENNTGGWVQAKNLTSMIDSSVFCNDPQIPELISRTIQAINHRDGNLLMEITSPIHGLEIRHEWWNPSVNFPYDDSLARIFDDPVSYEWGILQGSGDVIRGAFPEIILPLLDDITIRYSIHCNYLEQGLAAGGTAGFTEWPFEYSNLNYYSIYRSAEAGDELNWRTWAIGFVYIGEKPYITVMVQYHWEL